jgi:hypothetical protein
MDTNDTRFFSKQCGIYFPLPKILEGQFHLYLSEILKLKSELIASQHWLIFSFQKFRLKPCAADNNTVAASVYGPTHALWVGYTRP